MNKPYGLTGNIGCGKSTIADFLRANGMIVLDCDVISKGILVAPEHWDEISRILGTAEPFSGHSVDVKMIAQIVFSNPEIKAELEDYLHPLVWQRVHTLISVLPEDAIVFVESAILYETDSVRKCEAILVATCSEEEQVRRLRKDRRMSDEEINARMSAQLPQRVKESRADMVISTEGSMNYLKQEVANLCKKLKKANQKEEAK